MRGLAVIVAGLAVSACASHQPPEPPGAHFAKQSAVCNERGGALVPAFGQGANGGYTCRATGGQDARHIYPSIEVR
ncbi:hypothetical protein N0B44_17395 [Roseibacterium beibuensis]|uniref:hypothetical protein n=1 Tax=[Roseibacterium] beibuensis TaxID=1193142 RepID=UPI00217E67F5|nr:hypothetical protein [Roseibacterium beibuensis]MCS6624695.1 hypothetical protein [Roseibacterium beibuensis]